jgi:hypothetical protein
MADQERDDLDRDLPGDEEGMRGFEDEDAENTDEEDLEDEEQYDADERPTGEVGSEGGSPGETVVTRRRKEQVKGSEAGETWNPEQTETETVDTVGDEGQPRKRNP